MVEPSTTPDGRDAGPQATDGQSFAIELARLMGDRHCEDIRLLDVRGLSQVCDFVLLANGTSDRQMKSVADELRDFGRGAGHPAFRFSHDDRVTWLVVDFVDLVAHLFEPSQREYYDLDALWADAPAVVWRREAGA